MTHLEQLTRAGHRLARDLTEIDTIVRVVQSRPDWLPEAEEELAAIQRSLEYTLAKIRDVRELCAPPERTDGGAAFNNLIDAVGSAMRE
jgi:hypothetical protein